MSANYSRGKIRSGAKTKKISKKPQMVIFNIYRKKMWKRMPE